jgi:hypothetical protein
MAKKEMTTKRTVWFTNEAVSERHERALRAARIAMSVAPNNRHYFMETQLTDMLPFPFVPDLNFEVSRRTFPVASSGWWDDAAKALA